MKEINHIHVLMPDDTLLDVDFYVRDANGKGGTNAQLVIQLDDCICVVDIEKSVCKNVCTLERIVHNKVISLKGHLC